MSVHIEDGVAKLQGACGVEDAEPLFAALSAGRARTCDISACEKMHGAVAQALIRFKVEIVGRPRDPFLADFVAPALEKYRATRHDVQVRGVTGLACHADAQKTMPLAPATRRRPLESLLALGYLSFFWMSLTVMRPLSS